MNNIFAKSFRKRLSTLDGIDPGKIDIATTNNHLVSDNGFHGLKRKLRLINLSPKNRSQKGLIFALIFAVIGTALVIKNFAQNPYGDILTGTDELVIRYDEPELHQHIENDFSNQDAPALALYGNGLMLCGSLGTSEADVHTSALSLLKQRQLSPEEIDSLFTKIRSMGFDDLLTRKIVNGSATPVGTTPSISLITSLGERRATLRNNETSDVFNAIINYLKDQCKNAKDDFNPDAVVLESIKLSDQADAKDIMLPSLPLPEAIKINEHNASILKGAEAAKVKDLVSKGNKIYKTADGKRILIRVTPKYPETKQPKLLIKNNKGDDVVYADTYKKVRFLYVVAKDQAIPSDAQTKIASLAGSLQSYYATQLSQFGGSKTFTVDGISVIQSPYDVAHFHICPVGPDPAKPISCLMKNSSGNFVFSDSMASYQNLNIDYQLSSYNTIILYSWSNSFSYFSDANKCSGLGGPVRGENIDDVTGFSYGLDAWSRTDCFWSGVTEILGAHEGGHGFGLSHTLDSTMMSSVYADKKPDTPLNTTQAKLLFDYSQYFNGAVLTLPQPLNAGTTFVSVNPARLLDTRPGYTTTDGSNAGTGRLALGQTITLTVGGRAGLPTTALAAAFNVTAINPQADGYLVVFPCGTSPTTSSVNYNAGVTVSNMVISKMDSSGNVCIYTNNAIDLVVDVNGAFPSISNGSYTNLTPARFMDTRAGSPTFDGIASGTGRLLAGSTTQLQISGRDGIPLNASSVSTNVTVVNPAADGYVVLFPCGIAKPGTSSINYKAGTNISNAVIAKLGGGKVCMYVNNDTDIIVDVNGAFNDVTAFKSVAPARILETRSGYATIDNQFNGINRLAAGSTTQLTVAGRANVPSDALATALNVTVINPQYDGYATIYPCNISRPGTSNVNYSAGANISVAVLSKIGGGDVCIYVNTATDMVVDVNGAFTTSDVQQSTLATTPQVTSQTASCPTGYTGTYPTCFAPSPATGTITSANCAVIRGTARDADWPAGGLQIDIRIDSSYTSNPRPPDGTVYTDANGNWLWSIPNTATYKTSIPHSLWFDVLGKNASGIGDTWVAGSNTGTVSYGPCQASTCSAVQISYDNGASYGADIGYNGTATITGGTPFKVRMSMVNSAPLAGGTTWNTGSASQQVHVGTDGTNTRNDFRPLFGDFRTTDNSPATVLPGQTGYFVWGITAPNTDASQFKNYTMRFQNVQEWVEWFSTTGAIGTGNCQFNINVVPPSKCTGLTIYKDAALLGSSQSLTVGQYDYPLAIGNDAISSVHVPAGCQVTLYKDNGYTGATQVLTKDWPGSSTDPWNDITSSIKVEESAAITSTTPIVCGANGVTLFENSSYTGSSRSFSKGKYDSKNLYVGNDRLSSVRVTPGCKVILYQNSAFGGATKVLTGDWSAATGDPWNDITSSIEVKDRATVVADTTELLQDGGFEQGGLGWQATNPTGGVTTWGVKSVAGQAQAGTRYMEASSVPYGATIYQNVTTTPGTQVPGVTYRYTAWVRSPSCTAVSAYHTLRSLWSQTASYIIFTADCTWRQVSTAFTITNTGDTLLSPSFSLNTAGVALDMDSASLVRINYVDN